MIYILSNFVEKNRFRLSISGHSLVITGNFLIVEQTITL